MKDKIQNKINELTQKLQEIRQQIEQIEIQLNDLQVQRNNLYLELVGTSKAINELRSLLQENEENKKVESAGNVTV